MRTQARVAAGIARRRVRAIDATGLDPSFAQWPFSDRLLLFVQSRYWEAGLQPRFLRRFFVSLMLAWIIACFASVPALASPFCWRFSFLRSFLQFGCSALGLGLGFGLGWPAPAPVVRRPPPQRGSWRR